jgi:hypothetical protein
VFVGYPLDKRFDTLSKSWAERFAGRLEIGNPFERTRGRGVGFERFGVNGMEKVSAPRGGTSNAPGGLQQLVAVTGSHAVPRGIDHATPALPVKSQAICNRKYGSLFARCQISCAS